MKVPRRHDLSQRFDVKAIFIFNDLCGSFISSEATRLLHFSNKTDESGEKSSLVAMLTESKWNETSSRGEWGLVGAGGSCDYLVYISELQSLWKVLILQLSGNFRNALKSEHRREANDRELHSFEPSFGCSQYFSFSHLFWVFPRAQHLFSCCCADSILTQCFPKLWDSLNVLMGSVRMYLYYTLFQNLVDY